MIDRTTIREDVVAIGERAVRRIEKALAVGDIDEQYLVAMYRDPVALLIEVMGLKETDPLIVRPRSLDEVIRQFPQQSNTDSTKNIPIGVRARLNPTPLNLDVGPATESSGPLWVNITQPDRLIRIIEQANRTLNARRVRVFKNPAGAQLDQLWNTALRRSVIIARADQVPPGDLQRFIQLSREIPFHRVIITYPPRNAIKFPPEFHQATRLMYPDNAVYFSKIEPNGRTQRYFPLYCVTP